MFLIEWSLYRWQGNSADVNFWLAILLFRITRGGWQAAGVMKPHSHLKAKMNL